MRLNLFTRGELPAWVLSCKYEEDLVDTGEPGWYPRYTIEVMFKSKLAPMRVRSIGWGVDAALVKVAKDKFGGVIGFLKYEARTLIEQIGNGRERF